MAAGLEQVAKLPDPVGQISELHQQPSGIKVGRMRVPLGVIGIIYESRPNVTADAAALCLKSGNACILRGGSESVRSNVAIAACMHEGLKSAGLPENAVQVVATPDRAAVGHLLAMNEFVDIIVPRGGKDLIERVMRESRIPMIKHLDGVSDADIVGLNVPTGVPLVYELDAALKPLRHHYLGDPEEIAKRVAAVSAQGKAKA